jgi:YHS domain-containing protein
MFIDPVCYKQVNPETAQFSYEFNGKVFYFCSRSCRDKFDFEPARYADQHEIEHLYKIR